MLFLPENQIIWNCQSTESTNRLKLPVNYSPRATCIVVSLVDRKFLLSLMIYQNRCTFLQLKVVFSCLGHNCKFVRSSNAREILCLVCKILCVVRYEGGASGKGLVPRPPRGIATQVERVEEKTGTKKTQTNKNKLTWNKWCLRKVKFPQIIKLLANSSFD